MELGQTPRVGRKRRRGTLRDRKRESARESERQGGGEIERQRERKRDRKTKILFIEKETERVGERQNDGAREEAA